MRGRSMRAVVVLVAIVAAACGAGEPAPEGDPPGGVGAGGSTVPGADGGPMPPPGGDEPDAPGTTARPRRPSSGGAAGTAPPTTSASGDGRAVEGTAPAPGSGDVEPTPADDGSQGPPGAFARTLLRPQPATAIVLERALQSGTTLAEAAVHRSAGVLREVTAKPVDVRPPATVASDDRDWTADEVRQAADGAAGTVPQGGGRAVVRLVVLAGTFEGSSDVLGVAARGDVVALFADNIAGAATPLVSRRSIEDAVLLHELGHVLGLVDLARNTGRADKDHPGHSTNRRSVMYWAVESSLVGQVLDGPPPRDFDAQDLADLAALRQGA